MTPTLTFTCSICGEPSVSICVYCTKDACPNHLCERCFRCSDCCECDVRLDEHPEPVLAHEPAIVEELPIDGYVAPPTEAQAGEPSDSQEPDDAPDANEPHTPNEPHSPNEPQL